VSADSSAVCPVCGADFGETSRFCSQCGHRLDGETALGTPPHLFGVLAPGPTFVLGCVLLLAGLLALVAGSLVAAIVLVGFAGAAFVLFYGAAERDPESPVARRAMTSGRRVRGWALFIRSSVAAWAHAGRAVVRLRGEVRRLRRERDGLLRSLGEAAYLEDSALMGALRLRLREIDEALVARDRARAETLAAARQRVGEEHVAAQPTQRFSADELSSGGKADG